jgi:hypothetical protein
MGEIKDKISQMQARDFLATWTQIQNDHQTELNRLNRIKDNSDNTDDDKHKIEFLLGMSEEDTTQFLKDKLFIETGEDVEDIFIAFAYYKLV